MACRKTGELDKIYSGLLANPSPDLSLRLGKCIFGVDCDGKIILLEDESYVEKLRNGETPFDYDEEDHFAAATGEMWIPGLIDTHTHAAQYPNLGLGLDLPLLPWLKKYTFPLEARFADAEYASSVYQQVVKHLLKSGTTTAAYHATIHQEATRRLFSTCRRAGQRAVVGKVSMTRNGAPELEYEETPEESFRSAEEYLSWASDQTRESRLVLPSVTPRFAVTSYQDCLLKLGELATRYDCHVQTHISENRAELGVVQDQFPDSDHYAGVYEVAGLLNRKTVLAHGVHLSRDELQVIKAAGSGISHCPRSNAMLSSGLCCTRRMLRTGVKVGLGTDMSGGFSHSMFDALRQAVETSKILAVLDPSSGPALSTAEAFCLATLGSADVLAMVDKIGSIDIGKQFDAVLMRSASTDDVVGQRWASTDEDQFNRMVYTSDDRHVKRVYVDGALVVHSNKSKDPHEVQWN